MSSKIDPDAGARFLMGLLADEEAERLDNLTDDEYIAECKAKGREVMLAPSPEELLAKLQARAKQKAASDPSGIRVAPAAAATAPVERVATHSLRTFVMFLAAALVVGVFVVAANGPAIVALLRGDHVHEKISPEPPAAPQEMAAKLRHDAIGQCEQGAWHTCEEKLDEARGLDPAGESDPEVRRLRQNIDAVKHPPPKPDKPKPAP